MFEYEIKKVVRWIKDNGFRRVLIQSPLGLRGEAIKVLRLLEDEDIDTLLSGSNCWGGCDVAYSQAKVVNADAVIHMGHSRFLERDEVPTYYLECRYSDLHPLLSLAEKFSKILPHGSVGVGLTVQWLDGLDAFLDKLREHGLKPYVGEAEGVLRHRGQVLGCGYSSLLKLSSLVDSFLIVGSIFHGLGLALQTRKKVYAGDPHTQRITDLERDVERVLRARYAQIELFKKAEKVGIIVSVKPGQRRMGLALRLKSMLEEAGKEADIIAVDEVEEESLADFPYQGYVNTACPRLSIEDQMRLQRPLLLPSEVSVALSKASWESIIRTPRYLAMGVV